MIELSIQFKKNEGLFLNPTELKQLYLYGIKIQAKDGTEISESTWLMYIKSAQEQIEKFFGIKLFRQIISEDISFYRDEFEQFGFIRTNYPVVSPKYLGGFIGTIKQIEYPTEWLSSKKTNDGYSYNRQLYIVPNYSAAKTGSLVYNGVIPYLGILGYSQIPNYWTVNYVTGYTKLPMDLVNLIGMLATIGPLGIAGDLILSPGVSSQSLGIDGLSQSFNSKAFDDRIKLYIGQIKEIISRLKSTYKGINISSM